MAPRRRDRTSGPLSPTGLKPAPKATQDHRGNRIRILHYVPLTFSDGRGLWVIDCDSTCRMIWVLGWTSATAPARAHIAGSRALVGESQTPGGISDDAERVGFPSQLRAISRGAGAFARRFTAGRALFAGDDARDRGDGRRVQRSGASPAGGDRADRRHGTRAVLPGCAPVRETNPRVPRPEPAVARPVRKPNPAIGSVPRAHRGSPFPTPHIIRSAGYPDMTVRQLCDALDARYASRKLPAERHIQQLVAKVATADDATTAAAAMAKFHHRRAAAFATMKLPRKRHGLTPQSLMMFIGACRRVGAASAALAAAENHNAIGLPMIRPALLKLCEACEDVDQVLRGVRAVAEGGVGGGRRDRGGCGDRRGEDGRARRRGAVAE